MLLLFRGEDLKFLNHYCDEALLKIIQLLECSNIVAIGKTVYNKVIKMKKLQLIPAEMNVVYLPHPSPANPAANKGWADIATRSLSNMNIF